MILNPKNASLAALISALMPVVIKHGDLTQFDWASIISLSIGAITTLIAEMKNKNIVTAEDLNRFLDRNKIDQKITGVVDLDNGIIVHLYEMYRCRDPMFIVDARTNSLEWLNFSACELIGVDPYQPMPQRNMNLFWRKSDLEELTDLLFSLEQGKSIIHEYQAAFSNPYDWRQATTQFKLVELDDGSFKRISRSVERPVQLELPFDQRRYLRELAV